MNNLGEALAAAGSGIIENLASYLPSVLGALALLPPIDRPLLRIRGYDYKGGTQQLLRLIRRRRLYDHVTVDGPLSGHDKLRFLCEAEAYVHPSRWECHSIALLESLALGTPCLVSDAIHVAATRRNFDARVKAGAYADNPEGIWKHIVETHTPLDVAGRMAREAGVRTLVLNHIIPGGWEPALDDEFYRREVAREFKGTIVIGRDGLEI